MLVSLLVGYLCGSIPFGLILTRMAGLGDVRSIGSGNIGATNVLRTGNKKLAALTLLLDALKGTVAVLAARYVIGMEAALIAGLAAFLGHLYPVWLKFKGGKGVATYLGVLLGLAPLIVLVFAAIWLGMAKLFRYSSLAALTAAVAVPIALYLYGRPEVASLFVVMSVITILKHHQNISRLLSGTEGRIGDKG
ncbi:MAG: glycerol-3-phosphate 1-O-acyltransferase PlsY [Hoeflea sp.]|uniref:glycerol-3-phosphate 1-O-acyltransferase PlsY n=1 Tax=Hoeflea sp. TaxID=1940281 RepID=UPI001D4FF1A2|nr:glycerol-3-phosphate 1-O-acyltransferase PlsY [Hoeflea sp.]MBU4528536.1 glycerol-3-phosphate 1-O-acyltransferase PlsY [Alphaproteobacteria bacterium]MBU4542409.1 glycerol-3-phosphate 1-O-acyltransferase PlsY [Alphaproteobacteria bacterium]MBU4550146.1 glycerol-3-phosphate 1-O-acyltransferase PlsY [Alphaproteobacteria bacterium]MBV1726140.1 glycerol-3-phosphate 1-O-acyltransferase PlsY [Hoeflea sp.]MBV1762750.1 glycerol-3-phosphate 1-O-acyltransferase PlsY [Hoeflea sp.]